MNGHLIQYTPDNLNLQGTKEKVRVIECSSYRVHSITRILAKKIINSSTYRMFTLIFQRDTEIYTIEKMF